MTHTSFSSPRPFEQTNAMDFPSGDHAGARFSTNGVASRRRTASATVSTYSCGRGSLLTSSSYVWPCWSDARRGNPDVFAAQIPLIPNGAQVAFRNVQLGNRRISMAWQATPVGAIDPEDYYDFQVTRPVTEVAEGKTERLVWPTTRLLAAKQEATDRDLLLVSGIEPNMRWRGFCSELLEET